MAYDPFFKQPNEPHPNTKQSSAANSNKVFLVLAIIEAYEISADWDQPNESIAKLRRCESAKMLSDDRYIALLHFSYVYLENNEEAEAIRALKKIQTPDQMWGVWPMMALCHSNLENFDETIKYLKKAQQQVPVHPRNHWLGAVIDSAMDQDDEAADRNAAALAMMPQDTSLYWTAAWADDDR